MHVLNPLAQHTNRAPVPEEILTHAEELVSLRRWGSRVLDTKNRSCASQRHVAESGVTLPKRNSMRLQQRPVDIEAFRAHGTVDPRVGKSAQEG